MMIPDNQIAANRAAIAAFAKEKSLLFFSGNLLELGL